MSVRNVAKADAVLKNFWKDNARFADLFNAVLFDGEQKLHPVITLCIYYGEKEWDGAVSLKEMLELPDYMEHLVPDYKMNLIQLKDSEGLHFKNKEVQTIFELSRLIYQKKYGKITSIYKSKEITSELGIVIGAITESQQLINYAAEMEIGGGQFNMCRALEELVESGIEKGKIAGRIAGIEEGRLKTLTEQIEKKLAKNKTPDVIADELETEIPVVEEIIENIKKNASH